MSKIEFNIDIPLVPNFLFVGGDRLKLPLSDFSDEQLYEVADLWKYKLLNRAKEMRKGKEVKL